MNGTSMDQDLPKPTDFILDDSLSDLMTECIKIVHISLFAKPSKLDPATSANTFVRGTVLYSYNCATNATRSAGKCANVTAFAGIVSHDALEATHRCAPTCNGKSPSSKPVGTQ